MHADAYYSIGKAHTVCQDVARSGVARGTLGVDVPYVVVCDGCSGSPQTEFGAQILAQTTVYELRNFQAEHTDEALARGHFIKGLVRASIFRAAMIARECRLPAGALDATLLTATVAGGVAHLSMSGDGAAFWRERDGRCTLVTVEFNHGAPAYPSYTLDDKRYDGYRKLSDDGLRTVSTYTSEGAGLHRQGRDEGHRFALIDTREESGMEPLVFQVPAQDVDLVAVASDGLGSFQRRVNGAFEGVHAATVAQHAFAFKNYAGSFVTRRLRRLLSSEAQTMGWHHDDDLSVGAIFIPESEGK